MSSRQSMRALRQIDFLAGEIELVDIEIAKQVLASEDIRRLMTLPGRQRGHRDRDAGRDR
jgi:hypothetical protein